MSAANPYAQALAGTIWDAPEPEGEPTVEERGQAELDRIVSELLNGIEWEGVDHDGDM